MSCCDLPQYESEIKIDCIQRDKGSNNKFSRSIPVNPVYVSVSNKGVVYT